MNITPDKIPKKRPRYLLGKVVGVGVIIFVGYIAFSWMATKQNIEEFCSEITPNAVVADIQAKALATGLRFFSPNIANENGQFLALVTSSTVFGRYVCEIEHDGTVVTKTQFQFND